MSLCIGILSGKTNVSPLFLPLLPITIKGYRFNLKGGWGYVFFRSQNIFFRLPPTPQIKRMFTKVMYQLYTQC